MWLTSVFVHRTTLVFVLIALVTLFGALAFHSIVEQQYPNVDQPTVRIVVNYPGASTTIMQQSVVEPIENALAGAQDLLTTNSVVQTGTASISAIFTLSSSIDTDLVLVQQAVQTAQRQLPTTILPPTISLNNPSEIEVVVLQLTSKRLTTGPLNLLATGRIAPTIQQIPGVSYVTVQGGVTPSYQVTVNPTHLSAAAMTLNDVIFTVTGNNVLAPGGFGFQSNRQTQINIRGDIQTPASILDLPMQPSGTVASTIGTTAPSGTTNAVGVAALPGIVNPWSAQNQVLRVRDIATVTDAFEQPRLQYGQVGGVPSLILSVQKSANSSEVTSAENVINAVPQLQRQFPDVTLTVINNDSIFAKQQVDSVEHTLIEGIVLTGLVMLFFLRSWRSAVVVLVAIPTSLSVALFVMWIMGMTLDTVSLLGMTLAIGILIDDSTVVLENVERHFQLGQDPETAAIEGRSEIGMAAIVITLVDVVVFLPIAFLQGQVGRNLYEFAVVVVISTLTSLFMSFTVTPTLAGRWALLSTWKPWRVIDAFTYGFDAVRTFYADRILPWGMARPITIIAVCLLSFVGSVAMVPLGLVGETFIPPQDQGQIFVQINYPVGTPITVTRQGTFALEDAIDKTVDLQHDSSTAGGYSASFGGFVQQANVGQIHTFLKDNRVHPTSYWVEQYREMAARIIKNAQVIVVPVTGSTGGNAQPIDTIVSDATGGDPTIYAQQVLKALQSTPGATNVNSTGALPGPAVDVEFDRARARALNVSTGTAAAAAASAFGGTVATSFQTPYGVEEVQIIYPVSDMTNTAALAAIPIRSTTGYVVHLGDVARFQIHPVPPLITRTNRNDVIHVDANIASNTSLSDVQNAFMQRVAALHLPRNITVTPTPLGQQDLMQQTLAGIGSSLVLSVVLVYLLMVALYNSYRDPLVILFSVPVATVGAVGALYLTNQTLNLFSLIGTILLVGIVTKNGILIVDYANTLRDRGLEKLPAIKESAKTRFRPIIMTSISVIAANIPLALGLEPGGSVRSSLGIVVIGGVSSSLILTLVLIPIMYMYLAPKMMPTSHAGSTGNGSKAQTKEFTRTPQGIPG